MSRPVPLLVIEDNTADVGLIRRALRSSTRITFDVTVAMTLQSAVELLQQRSFPAGLLDLSLPDSQGLDSLTAIIDVSAETAIVVLTGLDDEEIALRAVQQGAQDYLTKGRFEPEVLTRTISHAMERLRLRTDLRQANEELEQRVRKRTAELERLQELWRRQQKELSDVDRLSTLGEMASGLAHEINQPLQAIVGFTSAARALVDVSGRDEEVVTLLDDAAAQASHAGNLITQLRQLIKPPRESFADVAVNELLRDALRLTQRSLNDAQIRVELDFGPEQLVVRADRLQMQQVLMNLIQNARQALCEVPQDRRVIGIRTLRHTGKDCLLEISDNGPGIAAGVQDTLFDPFATTKADGLGLGLAICQTIVERHRGTIDLVPTQAAGATLRITLPLASARAPTKRKSAPLGRTRGNRAVG